jgi:calcineurin-like phosphoesterase family protein
MSDIWITADTHFNHKGILEANSEWGWRPFENVEEMNEAFIQNWNEVVHPGDRVYHVGDFQFTWKRNNPKDAAIVKQLNGQVFLLEGNHDRTDQWPDEMVQQFAFIRDRYRLKVKNRGRQGGNLYVMLDHYPLRTWKRKLDGALHCHGHVHGAFNVCPLPGTLDVGIDNAFDKLDTWRPFHLDEVLEHIQARQFWDMVENKDERPNAERFLLDWDTGA